MKKTLERGGRRATPSSSSPLLPAFCFQRPKMKVVDGSSSLSLLSVWSTHSRWMSWLEEINRRGRWSKDKGRWLTQKGKTPSSNIFLPFGLRPSDGKRRKQMQRNTLPFFDAVQAATSCRVGELRKEKRTTWSLFSSDSVPVLFSPQSQARFDSKHYGMNREDLRAPAYRGCKEK